MTLNMKNGGARFFKNKDLDTRANLCKEYFCPETIKNDKGDVLTRGEMCDVNRTDNSIN